MTAYHHSPEAMPPVVETWARLGGERIEGPDGPGSWHVLTDAELEAMVAVGVVGEAR